MPSENTKIEWTNKTWSPITGCSKVSPGCAHCYAETLSLRYGYSKLPWLPKNADQNVFLHPERLEAPLKWRKPAMIFVNSMSDLFHENVPDEFIFDVFCIMEKASHHTFQVLTKRPERMAELVARFNRSNLLQTVPRSGVVSVGVLPNVWLGVSVENQYWANMRIPLLLATPAQVRFLSCEPLLGPVDLGGYIVCCPSCDQTHLGNCDSPREWPLHWVIVGGESAGPKRRYMKPEWARSIRDQCITAGVPFFFKQSSAPRAGQGRELDGRLWEQWPV